MATRIIRQLVDDLDGGDAHETVPFAFDGVEYTIDLSDKHTDEFRAVMAPYVGSGTRIGRKRGVPIPGGRAATAQTREPARNDKEQNKAIRAWAKREGKEISDRGRIPQEIVDEYHAKAGR